MKNSCLILIVLLNLAFICDTYSQNSQINKIEIQEDLNAILSNITNKYVYLNKKKVDVACIKEKYSKKIEDLKTKEDAILLFEYLMNEFYDSHISLTTNIKDSYRLSSPIYVEIIKNRAVIKNVWQTQIKNLNEDIIFAEIVKFNGIDFFDKINNFPTTCNDKNILSVKNWIANKVISGKYSEPRVLGLKLKNGKRINLDLDTLSLKKESNLLTSTVINNIGIIRINNSLGNNLLIEEFDNTLNSLFSTKGLIIDLRNTNNGGNTYVAKGIMSRFINRELPYQKHLYTESYDNQPKIIRSWYELVSPRGKQYTKPVVILVGKWTGSMGEGIAIGFDGMKRAEIVGTEMKRLAGSDFDFKFKNQTYGYKLILQKLYHINGTPREKFVPTNYVIQRTNKNDEILEKGFEVLKAIEPSFLLAVVN